MKVFLDTNFIMDLFGREPDPTTGINPYEENAIKVIDKGNLNKIEFCSSFLSIANFAYLLRKTNPKILFNQITTICELFTIIPNDEKHLLYALDLKPKDFEDAVQYQTAISANCDCILTRNKKDFTFSQLPLYTPTEFLSLLSQ